MQNPVVKRCSQKHHGALQLGHRVNYISHRHACKPWHQWSCWAVAHVWLLQLALLCSERLACGAVVRALHRRHHSRAQQLQQQQLWWYGELQCSVMLRAGCAQPRKCLLRRPLRQPLPPPQHRPHLLMSVFCVASSAACQLQLQLLLPVLLHAAGRWLHGRRQAVLERPRL